MRFTNFASPKISTLAMRAKLCCRDRVIDNSRGFLAGGAMVGCEGCKSACWAGTRTSSSDCAYQGSSRVVSLFNVYKDVLSLPCLCSLHDLHSTHTTQSTTTNSHTYSRCLSSTYAVPVHSMVCGTDSPRSPSQRTCPPTSSRRRSSTSRTKAARS